jgi:hypothetical protein
MSPARSAGAPSSWIDSPRTRLLCDGLLLALGAVTLAACLGRVNPTLRLLLILASACVLPGSALVARLGASDVLEAFVIAVTLGFCVQALGALAMAFTGWWHPFGWGLALLIGSSAILAWDLRRSLRSLRAVR